MCDWVARDAGPLLLHLSEMRQRQARNLEASVKATDFSVLPKIILKIVFAGQKHLGWLNTAHWFGVFGVEGRIG